eukprot:gene26521-biopygen3823
MDTRVKTVSCPVSILEHNMQQQQQQARGQEGQNMQQQQQQQQGQQQQTLEIAPDQFPTSHIENRHLLCSNLILTAPNRYDFFG